MAKRNREEITWKDVDYLEQVIDKGGRALIYLARLMEYGIGEPKMEIREIRIRRPEARGGDYFVIVKGFVGDERVVGFGGGSDVANAITSIVNRLENGSLPMKPDEYAQPPA